MRTNKFLVTILTSMISFSAFAGTRLCYVQTKDAEGVYKDAIAQKQISTSDYQNHILLQEGDLLYTVIQSERSDTLQVAIFSQKDKSTLIIAGANGKNGVTLINEPIKRLVGCSAVNQ